MKQGKSDDTQFNFLTKEQLERFSAADKRSRNVGLVITLAFHLVLLAVLLFFSLKSLRRGELSVVTDADKEIAREIEEEELRQQEEIKDLAQKSIEEELGSFASLRAVAVNASEQDLSNPNQDGGAAKNETAENETAQESDPSDGVEISAGAADTPGNEPKKEYRGPSVLSWTLDGRRALYMPIPAYKCQGEGIVYVQIVVGRNGYVKKATVIPAPSASDECLRSCAEEAAKVSRFSTSDVAPENQVGEIVYKFIAQ